MNVFRPDRFADKAPPSTAEVEHEIRELRKASSREPAESGSEIAANSINSVLQRVAGTSVTDIDNLITELSRLRDHLQNEGQRVQHEITNYAQMSQAVLQSIKVMTESVGQFKRTAR